MRSTILRSVEILNAKVVKKGFEGPFLEWLETYMLSELVHYHVIDTFTIP